jgi:hypothetical protein
LLVAGESYCGVSAPGARPNRHCPARLQSEREAIPGTLHGGHEAQREQRPDLDPGKTPNYSCLSPANSARQSLNQIKTMHSMTLRIHEIMQRFSSLASEMREAENASQAETEEARGTVFTRQ